MKSRVWWVKGLSAANEVVDGGIEDVEHPTAQFAPNAPSPPSAARWVRGSNPGVARQMRGMTLVELLTVVVIVAILGALAAPSFGGLRRATGVSTAASELLGALHFARSSAIVNGLPVTLCLSADDLTCVGSSTAAAKGWLVFLEPHARIAASTRVVPPVLRQFHLPRDVVVHGSRPAVTFWPTTRASTTSTFDVCDVERGVPGRAVVVNQTGRPRVAAEEASCAP
jgi:type IV fimbrial biogenesis protein FimT